MKVVSNQVKSHQHGVDSKQGSAVVVFSAWNTMIGSAVTTLPWAYQKSGLVLGLAISLVSCFVSYYTCMLTVQMVEDDTDFAETLLRYFGKFMKINNDNSGPFGFYVGLIAPIILIGSAIVVCFIIMAQVIYPNILAI